MMLVLLVVFALVHQLGLVRALIDPKILVYVLCYDDYSCEHGSSYFRDHSWSRMMRLPQSMFFESYAITNLFPDAIHSDHWYEYDYVGMMSWKTPAKFEKAFNFGPFNMTDILHVTPEGTDVIALAGQIQEGYKVVEKKSGKLEKVKWKKTMLRKAVEAHPRFREVWTPLLQQYGRYNESQIRTENITAFYCNYWMARPQYVVQFISFMMKAQELLVGLPEIQEALWSDAVYVNKSKIARDVYGLDYYPYHAFVLERLTPFYFGAEGLKVFTYKKFEEIYDALPLSGTQTGNRGANHRHASQVTTKSRTVNVDKAHSNKKISKSRESPIDSGPPIHSFIAKGRRGTKFIEVLNRVNSSFPRQEEDSQ